MKQIETIDQSVLVHYREKWIAIGHSTEPANRAKVEEGIDLAYQAAGLKPPATKIWFDSPLQGALAAVKVAEKPITDRVVDQVAHQVATKVTTQVRSQSREQVAHQVGRQIWGQVTTQVQNQVWNQVWGQAAYRTSLQVWDSIFFGQHEADELSEIDLFLNQGLDCCKPMQGLIQIAQNAGWVFLFKDTAILTERTSRLIWRGEKCVHIEYPDGFCASKLSSLEHLAASIEA